MNACEVAFHDHHHPHDASQLSPSSSRQPQRRAAPPTRFLGSPTRRRGSPGPGTGDRNNMKPFVVNSHRRLVFPSNFFPEPDFSSIDTVEDLAAVVRRDFEVKAPTGSEIAARAESGGYANRYELLRDLGLHLYLDEPLRHHDVRKAAHPLVRRAPAPRRHLPPRPDPLGGRRAQGRRGRGLLPATARGVVARGRARAVRHVVRRVPPQAAPRHRPAGNQADGRRGGRHRLPARVPPGFVRAGLSAVQPRRHPRLPRERPRARGPAALDDDPAQPVPVGPLGHPADPGGRPEGRRRRGRLPAPQRGRARLHPSREERRTAPAEHSSRPAGPPAGHPARAGAGPVAVRGAAPYRGSRRPPGRDPLHQRRHRPQLGLQLVADERGGDRGQDRHREPLLHRGRPRASRPRRGGERARAGRPVAGGDGCGHLLHVHQHPSPALGRDLALGPARHVPDPHLGRPRGGLRGLPLRPRGRHPHPAGGPPPHPAGLR